jgi:hypothetical protein
MAKKLASDATLVFSYLQLRTAVGVLGTALPFVLALGAAIVFGKGIQSSMSYYYHTPMRDVFVGTLFAIGFFLLSYQGYERADNIAGNLACVFAVGVALFPTPFDPKAPGITHTIGIVHFAFATLLFGTLIFFCLFLFTKTNPRKKPTRRKLQRNMVYRACGGVMTLCIVLALANMLLPAPVATALQPYSPLYWLEATAIVAFGISWLTKGEAILSDQS